MMQEKSFKKQISMMLVVAVLISFSAYLFIVPSSAVTPRWTSILSIDLSIAFDGTEGTVTGSASKKSTATRIEGTIYLYELVGDDWVYIDEWYNSRSRGTLAVSGDFTCASGVTYKAEFVVTAYTGTTPETETVESIKQCP